MTKKDTNNPTPTTAALQTYRKQYVKATTQAGKPTLNCGDGVAQELANLTLSKIYSLAAKELKVSIKELKAKYAHLNVGMQRMNLGNRIRRQRKAA